MSYILQTSQLTKEIDGKVLVKNVDINVKKGEIYGFVGPNGAGKTTIMKMVTNLWKPTSGYIKLLGEELTPTSYGVLKKIGSIIEFPFFYEHMSGKENLKLHCEYMGYYNSGCVDMALELLGLEEASSKLVKRYSLGMKQRLGIARAILCEPEILVLDEPTNGLDPAGIKQIRDLLKMLSTEYGLTIIISSHILPEIENIADTIGVINRGKLLKEVSMKDIAEEYKTCIELGVDNTKRATDVLADKLHLVDFRIIDSNMIHVFDNEITTKELLRVLTLNDVGVNLVGKKKGNLEDYFLKMVEEVHNDDEND